MQHVLPGEGAVLLTHHGVEGQLQEDIAQLVRGRVPILVQQGAGGLDYLNENAL